DVGANEALLPYGLEQLAKLAFATLHKWCANLDSRIAWPCQRDFGDLRGTLALHGPTTVRAMRRARARPKQTQVVVDLRDGADRGPRIVSGGFLLDGNRRRQPFDRVDVGLFHQPEKLSCICGQRFDVTALALGVDRVERQRGLAGSRKPGDDRQLIARDSDVDVAEVVLSCTAYDQRVFCHSQRKLRIGPVRDKALYSVHATYRCHRRAHHRRVRRRSREARPRAARSPTDRVWNALSRSTLVVSLARENGRRAGG